MNTLPTLVSSSPATVSWFAPGPKMFPLPRVSVLPDPPAGTERSMVPGVPVLVRLGRNVMSPPALFSAPIASRSEQVLLVQEPSLESTRVFTTY